MDLARNQASLEAIEPGAAEAMPVAQALALDEPRRPPTGCEFSKWLFAQQHRPDGVGQLAHVVARDPMWRGGDRLACVAHLARLGARADIQDLMGRTYDEWERKGAQSAARAKAKAKKAAQKAMRRKQQRR